VPAALAGLKVSVAIGATEIRVMHCDREVARHERLDDKVGTRATLDHYLQLLARKPGALAPSIRGPRNATVAAGQARSTSRGQRFAPGGAGPRRRSRWSMC
jgi:hypothetical protein